MAVAALCYYALIQYFMNSETSRMYVLTSLSTSHVLRLLDTKQMTSSELFGLAIEKHESFTKTSDKMYKREYESNISYLKSRLFDSSKNMSLTASKVSPSNETDSTTAVHGRKSTSDSGVGLKRLAERGASVTRVQYFSVYIFYDNSKRERCVPLGEEWGGCKF
jgi:hypothetical protein